MSKYYFLNVFDEIFVYDVEEEVLGEVFEEFDIFKFDEDEWVF